MAHAIDEVDRRIIALLQADGRRSNVDIAQELSLAEGTVRKRLERILTDGVLRITAVVDPARVGLLTTAIITMQVDLGRMDEIVRQLAVLPEVQSVSVTTGNWDVILEAVFPTDGELLAFLKDRVAAIPGVRRTETSHVLRRAKHVGNWELPLELAAPAPGTVEPEMLRQTESLADLGDEELALIARISQLKTYEAGARIFSENDSAQDLYILTQGRVAMLVDIGQGRQAMMGTVGLHEFLGWPALVPPYAYAETARCVERTTVIVIPAAGLRELCQNNCDSCYTIMEKIAALISSQLKDARFQLTHILQADKA